MVKRRGSAVIGDRRSMRMSGHILRRHRQLHAAAFRADGEDGLVRVHCGRQGLHGARRLAESWANLSSTWRRSGGVRARGPKGGRVPMKLNPTRATQNSASRQSAAVVAFLRRQEG